MGKIHMLNLYRCSSAENNEAAKEVDHFVTDYFDGIKVEKLNLENTSLSECMGIKRDVNSTKKGISHQRYCLFSENDENEDIFQVSADLPLLTVIQIFINHDVYQAESFDDGNEISCTKCMERAKNCIEGKYKGNSRVKWEMYRLLTAGDFAVIVRSSSIHNAYDISTLLRSIRLVIDDSGDEKSPFYSYSISGVLDGKIGAQDIYKQIQWNQHLNDQDEVIVRTEFSQSFWGKCDDNVEEEKQQFLKAGQRLFGRYDHQIIYKPEEFQELYPYIRNYKFGDIDISDHSEDSLGSEKVKILVRMIKHGFIAQINEKIFLKYTCDPLLSGSTAEKWRVICKKEWKFLYESNKCKIQMLKDEALDIEKDVEVFYPSARNLKEYMRLMGRLCRILFEINQMHELRISVANLLNQLEVLLCSFRNYLDSTKQWDRKSVADSIEGYLLQGIGSLEIFTRYIRNVNLQTLQTPNYDLQTNVCVEKVLLAYSQFLRFFMSGPNQVYCRSNILYPIIVPNMDKRDLSVSVLFDDDLPDSTREKEKLMVVNSPTFLGLCETCFLMPTVFHEIAHQFRYEERAVRNKCLEKCILKSFITSIVEKLVNGQYKLGMFHEEPYFLLIDAVYDELSGKLMEPKIMEKGLQTFRMQFQDALQGYVEAVVNEGSSPDALIKNYIFRTKGDVQKFDDTLQQMLSNMKRILEELEQKNTEEEARNLVQELKRFLYEYKNIQEDQILDALEKSAGDPDISTDISDFVKKMREKKRTLESHGLMEKGKAISVLWKGISGRMKEQRYGKKVETLLRQYQDVLLGYMDCQDKLNGSMILSETESDFQNIYRSMCRIIYEKLIKKLEELREERQEEICWPATYISAIQLEQIRIRIKSEGMEGLEDRIRSILTMYRDNHAREFVDTFIERYREVTSDLFMCAIIGLDMFGYLVVAAQSFNFMGDSRDELYNRVFEVLQCLYYKDGLVEPEGNALDKALVDKLAGETQKLYLALQNQEDDKGGDGRIRFRKIEYQEPEIDWKDPDIQSILDFLDGILDEKCTEDTDISSGQGQGSAEEETCGVRIPSTRKWIVRIYRQIAYIVYNLLEARLMNETIGEKEIWHDIVGESSYCRKEAELQSLLKNSNGQKLCQNISEILNSPAGHFIQKKELALEEVRFILKNYEDDCRYIWKKIYEGEKECQS